MIYAVVNRSCSECEGTGMLAERTGLADYNEYACGCENGTVVEEPRVDTSDAKRGPCFDYQGGRWYITRDGLHAFTVETCRDRKLLVIVPIRNGEVEMDEDCYTEDAGAEFLAEVNERTGEHFQYEVAS